MFRFVVLACFLATFAAAITTSPSMLSQSRVAAAASPLAVAPMPRVAPGAVVMSGDGEHEVLYESASALELRTLHRCIFLNGGSHSLEGRTVSSGWGGAARTAHLRPNPKTRRGQFRWPLRLTLGHSTCGAATEPGGGWSRRGRTQRGKRPSTHESNLRPMKLTHDTHRSPPLRVLSHLRSVRPVLRHHCPAPVDGPARQDGPQPVNSPQNANTKAAETGLSGK